MSKEAAYRIRFHRDEKEVYEERKRKALTEIAICDANIERHDKEIFKWQDIQRKAEIEKHG